VKQRAFASHGLRGVLWLTLLLIPAGCGTSPPAPATGGPPFVINSPAAGSTVSGPVFFSVQPLAPNDVHSVHFEAGGTAIVPQYPGEHKFRVFLMPRDFADGILTLTATVTGHDGNRTHQSITVQVVASPPSRTVVASTGAILGTVEENGATSVLYVPAGIGEGATVSFEARTQAAVKVATGVDYEAMGVTFLGAQEVTTDRWLGSPLMVSSGGFGPMVQPGQAVVNYVIAPDGDGNGSGELVVVNTASVAPNGDVISDPVPWAQVAQVSSSMSLGSRGQLVRHAQPAAPPGGQLTFTASGFNAAHRLSNLVVFRTGGQTFTTFATYLIDAPPDASAGVISFVVPDVPPGLATLELWNLSTGSRTPTFDVLIESPAPMADSPHEVIATFLTAAIKHYASSDSEQEAGLAASFMLLKHEVAVLQADASPETDAWITSLARVLAGAGSTFDPFVLPNATPQKVICQSKGSREADMRTVNRIGFIGDVLTGSPVPGIRPPPYLLPIGIGLLLGAEFLQQRTNSIPLCPPGPNTPPPTDPPSLSPAPPTGMCTPSNPTGTQGPSISPRSVHHLQATSGTFTGMGSALPPGGPGCGSALAGNTMGAATRLSNRPDSSQGPGILEWFAQEPGRIIIKVFVGGVAQPFTGITDATGYFFVPFIPVNQAFLAIATDTWTGEVRTFEGIGRPTGESVFMFFDFISVGLEDPGLVTLDSMLSSSISPGANHVYFFEATAGQVTRFGLHTDIPNAWPTPLVGMSVTSPSGDLVGTTGNRPQYAYFHRIWPAAIQETGRHMLVVGNSSGASVEYTIGLVEVEPPTPIAVSANGVAFTGNLSVLYAEDRYSFQGEAFAAAKLVVTHPATSDLQAQFVITNPSGSPAYPQRSTSEFLRTFVLGPVALLQDGTYTLSIEASEGLPTLATTLGAYEARLFVPPVTTLQASTNTSGRLGGMQLATHRAPGVPAGLATVAVYAQRPADAPVTFGTFELMFSGGGFWTHALTSGLTQLGLVDLTGNPAIVVNNLTASFLDYEIAVTPLPEPIDLGGARPTLSATGSIDVIGEIVSYAFSGEAAEVATLTVAHPLGDTSVAAATVYATGPDGGRLGWLGTASTNTFNRSASISFTLPSAGTYLVDVSTIGGAFATSIHVESLDEVLGTFGLTLAFE
jgi:hypothetical protein